MKYLIFILFSFQSSAALNYYLKPCSDNNSKLCRIGLSPGAPKGAICKVKYFEESEDVYEVKIVKTPDGIIENIQEWFDLNSRDWTPDAVLEEGEFIRCQVDKTKLQDLKDQRAQQREAQRQARLAEVDRLDKLDRAKRQYCRKQNKQALEKILCAEWKREALSDQ